MSQKLYYLSTGEVLHSLKVENFAQKIGESPPLFQAQCLLTIDNHLDHRTIFFDSIPLAHGDFANDPKSPIANLKQIFVKECASCRAGSITYLP